MPTGSEWLSSGKDTLKNTIGHLSQVKFESVEVPFLPHFQEFQSVLEKNLSTRTEFIELFQGVQGPKDYAGILNMLNDACNTAPSYGGVDVYAGFLVPLLLTQVNHSSRRVKLAGLTRQHLDRFLQQSFHCWTGFISSPNSRSVLVDNDFGNEHYGWFHKQARKNLMEFYGDRGFEEVFECKKGDPYHGFDSFDHFLTRRYRSPDVDRPVTGGVVDLGFISAACEAEVYNIQGDLQSTEQFFLKDEPYTLHTLLDEDIAHRFVGGTVYQAFLSPTDYHRWHAPVSGRISTIKTIPGTYLFHDDVSVDGDSIHHTSRSVIFIEADNANIGLLCFITVGMTDVSTLDIIAREGQHVQRGDEIGMFHFGGSSYALLFNKDAKIKMVEKFKVSGTHVRINEAIGMVTE